MVEATGGELVHGVPPPTTRHSSREGRAALATEGKYEETKGKHDEIQPLLGDAVLGREVLGAGV